MRWYVYLVTIDKFITYLFTSEFRLLIQIDELRANLNLLLTYLIIEIETKTDVTSAKHVVSMVTRQGRNYRGAGNSGDLPVFICLRSLSRRFRKAGFVDLYFW